MVKIFGMGINFENLYKLGKVDFMRSDIQKGIYIMRIREKIFQVYQIVIVKFQEEEIVWYILRNLKKIRKLEYM